MLLYALLGAAVGSFLNVCIDRLPRQESLWRSPSHCLYCGRRLEPLELVPVLSFLVLGGRCRTCGAPIPRRILIVEIGTALLFVLLGSHYGPGPVLWVACTYTAILIVVFFIDLEHHLVLNKVIYPASGLALAISLFRSLPGDPLGLDVVAPAIGAALLGGVVGFVALFLPAWLSGGGIGAGDVKLGAFLGLALGFPAILAGLFLGFLAGGIGAAVLLLARRRSRRDPVPYAPFLTAGAWVGMLYGNQIMTWYFGRF